MPTATSAKLIPLINPADVTDTYAGAEGCSCGCRGTYSTAGGVVTRRVRTVNQAIANGEQVETYSTWFDEVVYEYVKPNGRIIRIYAKKN